MNRLTKTVAAPRCVLGTSSRYHDAAGDDIPPSVAGSARPYYFELGHELCVAVAIPAALAVFCLLVL